MKRLLTFIIPAILILSVFSISLVAAQSSDCNLWCRIAYLFTGKVTGSTIVPVITGKDVAGVQSASNCDPSMVNYWQGNGNAADTLGNNNGNIIGTVNFVPGKVGQAFSFSGNGRVEIPFNTTNTCPNKDLSYTMEAWVNLKDPIQGVDNRVFLSAFYGLGEYKMNWQQQDQNLFIIGGYNAFVQANLNRNQWYFLTVVSYVDSSKPSYSQLINNISINGVLVASGGTDINSCYNPYLPDKERNYADLGGYPNTVGGTLVPTLNGTVDEIALYNRSLSQAEIMQHYQLSNQGVGYCEAPDVDGDGYSRLQGDCNDNPSSDSPSWNCPTDPNNCVPSTSKCAICIHPGAKESLTDGDTTTCWDGVDNNCNGQTDQNDRECQVSGMTSLPACDPVVDPNADNAITSTDVSIVNNLIPCYDAQAASRGSCTVNVVDSSGTHTVTYSWLPNGCEAQKIIKS